MKRVHKPAPANPKLILLLTLACSRKCSTISLSILDGLGGGLKFVAFPEDSLRPDQR